MFRTYLDAHRRQRSKRAGRHRRARAGESARRSGHLSVVEAPVAAAYDLPVTSVPARLEELKAAAQSALDRFLFGSVAEGALRRATRPYLIIRDEGEEAA